MVKQHVPYIASYFSFIQTGADFVNINAKRHGDKTEPWLTPFLTEKDADMQLPYLTNKFWCL